MEHLWTAIKYTALRISKLLPMWIRKTRYPSKNASTNWRRGSGASGQVQNKLHNNTHASKTDYDAPKQKGGEGVIRRKHHYRNIAQACRNRKSKLSWNWNRRVTWRATRRASTGTLAARRRTKDITGSLLTQDVKKADTLCAFFTSVSTGKIRLPGFLCLVAGEKFHLQQQRKIKVGTTCTNRTHKKKSMGPDGMPQGVHWEIRPKSSQGRSLPSLKKHRNLVRSPMIGKRQMSHLSSKRGRKRIQLKANQTHLSPWKCYRTNSPRNGDWDQPQWTDSTQLPSMMRWLVLRQGEQWHVVYFTFNKVFNKVSPSILERFELDGVGVTGG